MINTKSCKKIVLRKVIFMDKRLCILNPMDSGRKIECKTLQDKFNTVGGNPGNLMFYESVKKEVPYSKIINVKSYEEVNDEDVVVIPSSNFLMHGGNDSFFQGFIDFLDNTKCQVTLV
mgnify:FL=1